MKCGWCGSGHIKEWIEVTLFDEETARAKCLICEWRHTGRLTTRDEDDEL